MTGKPNNRSLWISCAIFVLFFCVSTLPAQNLEPAGGLQPAKGLHPAKLKRVKLQPAVKLDSQSTPFSYRAPKPPPREIFPEVDRVALLPNNSKQLYSQTKLAINKAGKSSILKEKAVGALVGLVPQIKGEKPFVMEYSAFLENGEAVYFVPLGMTDPVKMYRYQILSFLGYPPREAISDHEKLREWIEYAGKKIETEGPARRHLSHLLTEAEEIIEQETAR